MNNKLFIVFLFLAVFQIPIVSIGNDSIGLFDLYLVIYFVYLVYKADGRFKISNRNWILFLKAFLIYIFYLISSLLILHDFRSILVLVKHIEYFLIFFILIVNVHHFEISKQTLSKNFRYIMLLLVSFQLLSWLDYMVGIVPGISPGLGFGIWYRVCLPFKDGVSSNPAGFVLGAYLLYYLESSYHQLSSFFFKKIFPIMILVTLFLTISRTNFLAFILVFTISFIFKMFKSTWYRIIFIVISLTIVITIGAMFEVLLDKNPEFVLLIKVLTNPAEILKDNSFMMRFSFLWGHLIENWLTSIKSIIIGNGIAAIPIADSTYLGLLANQGIIGLLLFSLIWFFIPYFSNRKLYVSLFLLYTFINGINAETLTLSYRSIQIYSIILILVIEDCSYGDYLFFNFSRKRELSGK